MKYFCHGGLQEKYFLYGGLLLLLLSRLCLTMEDASGCPLIHRVTDKSFDTLFSKKGSSTDEKYRKALEILGLSNIVNFTSCEDNISNLRKTGKVSQLLRGPSGSVIVSVPAKGDCWLISILAQLVGFIVEDEKDEKNIIPTVRARMSQIVAEEPEKFVNIFGGGLSELEEWTRNIRKWSPEPSMEKWGGPTEFKIFTRITRICVHLIIKEEQQIEPPVQHFLPRSIPKVKWEDEDWTVSVVVVYDQGHYEVLVPESLPSDINIREGTTDTTGLQTIDISTSRTGRSYWSWNYWRTWHFWRTVLWTVLRTVL